MIGFGSDNANVMIGEEGGIFAFLKERCPYLLN